MLINVLEYLENIIKTAPDKTAYSNDETNLTFQNVSDYARSVGTFLSLRGYYKEPVVVFMNRHPKTVAAFFGVVYSGCYYVPLDEEMPRHRIELILQSLNPRAVICDEKTLKTMEGFNHTYQLYSFDEICETPVNEDLLLSIRNRAVDIDPTYIVFTSGSTGLPKGVVACHRSVIDYIEHLSEALGFNRDTVFGSQTPLYVDACLKELYPTLKFGATTYLIPKSLFMFPIKLLDYLNEHKINTICWVASALTMVSAFGALEKKKPEYLHTVAFGSEVFPMKQFYIWKECLPGARFINLYGPTEATGMSCCYEVDRDFGPDEVLPVGRPFKNTEIILLDENKQVPKQGDTGEICIRGTALTLGYFNDFGKTSEAFVQNPLVSAYPDLIYRTGDLGKYNERGELVFVSRKDYQVKHMGHRIELGEIETVANMMDGIKMACCVFDDMRKKIVLYYVGGVAVSEAAVYLREKLPRYMVPNSILPIDKIPLTANGKIDRVMLKNRYMSEMHT